MGHCRSESPLWEARHTRAADQPLSVLMRRLMTGHAVRFNLRHGRSGHLFQNRYKSIVVEEEAYFLQRLLQKSR